MFELSYLIDTFLPGFAIVLFLVGLLVFGVSSLDTSDGPLGGGAGLDGRVGCGLVIVGVSALALSLVLKFLENFAK